MKTFSIGLALLLSPGSNPPARDFCTDVQMLAAAAEEPSPFASLRKRDFRPNLLRDYCFANDAGGYTCGQVLSHFGDTRDGYASRIAACLPGSTISKQGSGRPAYAVVRSKHFEARVAEHGTEFAHVGRVITIYIASTLQRREQSKQRPRKPK